MSRPRFRLYPVKRPRTEAGAALLAFLLVLLVGGSYALLNDAKSLAQRAKLEEYRKTTAALAEAKWALIGRAVTTQLTDPQRLGDMLCPDQDNNGVSGIWPDAPCGDANPPLGRLPWRTLGLPHLRDGAGEGLWYAVSRNFTNNPRTDCPNPSSAGCLNSDSSGTISVKSSSGSYLHDARDDDDGYTKSGAIAVVIAPGPPLRRVGYGEQDRSCTSTCDSRDFLELGNGEDNANFEDSDTDGDGDGDGSPDGFIQGDVLDSNGAIILNDRLLPIAYRDLVPLLEKRVVGDVLACLRQYADPTTGSNGRYPWAADRADVSDVSYSDVIDNPFGRLPDPQFGNVQPGMQPEWLSGCPLLRTDVTPHSYARWWVNWKELVFYAVADGHKPQASPPPTDLCATTPDSCLIVNPELSRKEVVVIAAGNRREDVPDPAAPPPPPPAPTLDQIRTTTVQKGDPRNYLEGDNASDDNPTTPPEEYKSFVSEIVTPTFNDVVGYLPRP